MKTALERREARPTATILLLSALMLPSVGTCGGIGACKARSAASDFVPVTVTEIADAKKVPVGTYVALSADLRFIAKDRLPLDLETDVEATGTQLYGIRESDSVVVFCSGACSPEPVTRGRVCDGDAVITCSLSDELKSYLRFQSKHGKVRRVLMASETPHGEIWEAAIGLAVAALMLAALIAVTRKILRGRRVPNISLARSVVLRTARDAARVALLLRASAGFRLAHDGPEGLVFLMGVSAARAQSMGVTQVDDVPRRLEIVFHEKPYEPLRADLRVSEIYPHPSGPPKAIESLTQNALTHSLAWTEQLLTSL